MRTFNPLLLIAVGHAISTSGVIDVCMVRATACRGRFTTAATPELRLQASKRVYEAADACGICTGTPAVNKALIHSWWSEGESKRNNMLEFCRGRCSSM